MKEEGRVEDYLRDMLEYAVKAEKFLGTLTYEEFAADEKANHAVARAIEIIGEAARRVPPDFRNEHAQIPWRDICGMRDKLIHDYRGLNHRLIWNTVQGDLPPLRAQLRELLREN